jgi:hypothetical protein
MKPQRRYRRSRKGRKGCFLAVPLNLITNEKQRAFVVHMVRKSDEIKLEPAAAANAGENEVSVERLEKVKMPRGTLVTRIEISNKRGIDDDSHDANENMHTTVMLLSNPHVPHHQPQPQSSS